MKVMRHVAAIAALLLAQAVLAVEPAGMVDRIDALQPFIGGYPPKFGDETQAKAVRQQYETIKQELDALLKAQPGDLDLLFLRGQLQTLGHNFDYPKAWDGATADLQAVLKAQAKHVPALLTLGRLWVDSRPDLAPKAENLFRAAQCFTGDTPLEEAQRGIFFAYYFQGRMQAALSQSEYLVKTWPGVDIYRELNSTVKTVLARNKPAAPVAQQLASAPTMASCQ